MLDTLKEINIGFLKNLTTTIRHPVPMICAVSFCRFQSHQADGRQMIWDLNPKFQRFGQFSLKHDSGSPQAPQKCPQA